MRITSSFALWLCVVGVVGCASVPPDTCPDLTGTFENKGDSGIMLSQVLGLSGADHAARVRLESHNDELLAVAGAQRQTLRRAADFNCAAQGLQILRPVSGGYELSGVIAEHTDRYFILARDRTNLVANTSDRSRVQFIGPELAARSRPGPVLHWRAAQAR